MPATTRFSLDGSWPPLIQHIAGGMAGDAAEVIVVVTGFAPGDVITQASFTAKLAKTDSDTAPTTVQAIYAPEAPFGPTVTPLDASSYRIAFPLSSADTTEFLTEHGYDVRLWVTDANGVLRDRTVQSGTISFALGD